MKPKIIYLLYEPLKTPDVNGNYDIRIKHHDIVIRASEAEIRKLLQNMVENINE